MQSDLNTQVGMFKNIQRALRKIPEEIMIAKHVILGLMSWARNLETMLLQKNKTTAIYV